MTVPPIIFPTLGEPSGPPKALHIVNSTTSSSEAAAELVGGDIDAEPLFALHLDRRGDVEEISRMKSHEYMKHVVFIWHVGSGREARQVQWRLREADMWIPTPAEPTVRSDASQPAVSQEELQKFLRCRFPASSNQLEQVPFETSSSEDGHREGKWFRIILDDAVSCAGWETSWHGSNLYVAGSIIRTGKLWPSKDMSGRLFGIFSHRSANRRLCGS